MSTISVLLFYFFLQKGPDRDAEVPLPFILTDDYLWDAMSDHDDKRIQRVSISQGGGEQALPKLSTKGAEDASRPEAANASTPTRSPASSSSDVKALAFRQRKSANVKVFSSEDVGQQSLLRGAGSIVCCQSQ
jgi:hypothetical protein